MQLHRFPLKYKNIYTDIYFINFSASSAHTLDHHIVPRQAYQNMLHATCWAHVKRKLRRAHIQHYDCRMARNLAKNDWMPAWQYANFLLERPHGTLMQTCTHTLDTFSTIVVQTLVLAIHDWAIELFRTHTHTHLYTGIWI